MMMRVYKSYKTRDEQHRGGSRLKPAVLAQELFCTRPWTTDLLAYFVVSSEHLSHMPDKESGKLELFSFAYKSVQLFAVRLNCVAPMT